ncbi:bifunctional lysylphosphatidylglycerol flippase/synthetase MprF [Lacticaseibacillus jixiensis]|uniref:bifunctional lysylphosphatidylglycerol flippase/synthetase MprF n=1 Tax=Lacticaseibacillus jixiensis TaxID=3231926 RepID=UPI0036F1CE98
MKKFVTKLLAAIQKHLNLLKALFMLSVIVFVIIEIGRIGRDLSGAAMRQSLATQSPQTLLLMAVLGLVAVLPMMNYDFTITKLLPGRFKPLYILRSGWIVNTFTNIAGFGGFLGASLRANFYHKGASRKQILFAISKIALFLLAGLSLWSMIALVLMFGFGIGHMVTDYWIWLIGAAAYFPVLMLITHFTQAEFFSDLPLRRRVSLACGSFLEWGGCSGFFLLIGVLMHATQKPLAVLPMFLIANVFGVLSMVPGGLGSFDVFMIFGLAQLGVDNNIAVVWLLFYRLFYYVIPFLIGALLFAQDAGRKLNAKLEGLPSVLLGRLAHAGLTLFLYFTAFMLLMRGVIPDLALRNALYLRFYPYTFLFLSRVTNIMMAFVIFGFARGIANRVRRAYWPTIVILVLGGLASWRQEAGIKLGVFVCVLIITALWARKALTRSSMVMSWGNKLIDAVIFCATAVFYALALFYNAPAIHHRHPVPEIFLFPSERMWMTTLAGVVVAAITLAVIYRYLCAPGAPFGIPTQDAKRRIAALIDRFGGTATSHLAFVGDKMVRFYQVDGEDRVAFLYKAAADKLMILGVPIGPQADWQAAIADFMAAAEAQNRSLVFYEVPADLTMQLHEYGFDFMKFGESAHVTLADFTLAGSRRKGERALVHKLERAGYTFAVLKPPFDATTLAALHAVSDQWLAGRAEEGFSLGYYDEAYLQQAPIAVIQAADAQIVAFASLMPMAAGVGSVDLMRFGDAAPNGSMDLLFINLFQYAKDAGDTVFDLGMAPLSNVGLSPHAFVEERLAHLVYRYGYRFYGFAGLRSYKAKYTDEWIPQYIAYRKRNSLLFTMLQLLLLVNRKQPQSRVWEPRRFRLVAKLDEWFN